MATPNLGITYIQASQNQKEVTANAAFLALDEALCQPVFIAMADADFYAAGGGSPAVTNMAFIFTGSLSDNRSVYLPLSPKIYIVMNQTTQSDSSPVVAGKSLTFKVPDGSPAVFGRTVTIQASSGYHVLYCDGFNVDEMQVSQCEANLAIALPDANYIPSSPQVLNYQAFIFTGALSDNRAILLPPIAKTYIVKNSCTGGKNLIFEIPSPQHSPAIFGRTVVVPPGSGYMMLYTDGVNVDTTSSTPVGLAMFAPGGQTNNQVYLYLQMDRSFVFPAGARNSTCAIKTAATGPFTITFKRGGVSFATLSVTGITGVFTQAADAIFNVGDILEVDGPAVADATVQNVGIVFQGYRF